MASEATRSRSSSPEFSPLAIGEDLTPLPEYKAAGNTDLDFSGYLSPPLKLHEDLKSGCGGQLWPAGMVLATHMLRHHRHSLKDANMYVQASCMFTPCHDYLLILPLASNSVQEVVS